MRSIRGKATELFERSFQAPEGIVKSAGEVPQFIVRIFNFQPRVQMFGVDFARAPRHSFDGAERVLHQQVTADSGQSKRQRPTDRENDRALPEALPQRLFTKTNPKDQRPSFKRVTFCSPSEPACHPPVEPNVRNKNRYLRPL